MRSSAAPGDRPRAGTGRGPGGAAGAGAGGTPPSRPQTGGRGDVPPTAAFDYPLPTDLVATRPAERRDASRLLVLDRRSGALTDRRFADLPVWLRPGDVLVLNDTRVFPARLRGRKPTGARVEVLLLRPLEAGARRWEALVRPGGKLKPGRRVEVADGLGLEIEDSTEDGGRVVRLVGEEDPFELIERHGEVPLPPYIDRPTEPADRERYQTVYAERTGSVAAPTAGLHFTPELLARIEERGVRLARITLHVGPGTFRPVEAPTPAEHALHPEPYEVTEEAAAAVNAARSAGGRVWAVGTTCARVLETVAVADGRLRPGAGRTRLFIHPPYRFRAVDVLITNFHLPRSSLLMLVAALAGRERILAAYAHAVRERYRFYSYGDAMLIL